ncbi:MAG: hypothetical protein BM557_07635 [Flavobacterium sp. MedPE-SWcel]|uniref:tetratricopeptide repeat protein n=1 Tax=uncultured Flavobacterium sp. TaxID=165435 RepID=UPI0009194986|nr:tetratricopeptide repeat protein [uncultured Flavobacterium sp.]OIQ18079.1 MAG: hypothetical protein BM557_07635 [Flavobacterium sp. MedPE-SWcel]
MKKYVIAASLLISISAFAQKDELKALRKMSKKGLPVAKDFSNFKSKLASLESKIASATEEQKVDYYFYKGEFGLAQMKANKMSAKTHLDSTIESLGKVIQLEKGMKRKKHTEEIMTMYYPELRAGLLNQATELGKQSKFKAAYPLFEKVYRISPKDTVHLYNAAAYATNSQDFPQALKYYKELQSLGFTGSVLNYTARNVEKNEVEYFGDKKTRDLFVANKTHDEPGIYRIPSKKADIVKNIALLYIKQGDKDKAMKALTEAKKANPDDMSLLSAESQIYLEAKDYENYRKTVTKILDKGSQDPNLYFNLGVTTAASGQKEDAVLYYKKAIELNPDFVGAYQNLAILQLDGEDAIVKEMNNLGNSSKDMKRYDELKKERDDMYKVAVKYLEKAHDVDPKNEDVKNILGTLYQGLEMMGKYKALKAE